MFGSNLGAFCAPFIAKYMGATSAVAMRNAGWMYVIMAVIIVIVFVVASARMKENYKEKETKYV
jgi:nitrate/nitrite transporter NarK